MNFTKNRKGQTVTDYLITYGWLILAVAIIGALLYTQIFHDPQEQDTDTNQTTSAISSVADVNQCIHGCNACPEGMLCYRNSDAIYVRHQNDVAGCYEYSELLKVSGATPNQIQDYETSCLDEIGDEYWDEYSACIRSCVD